MTNEPPRRHARLARPLAALAIAVIAVGSAGCGDDKKDTTAATTAGNGAAASGTAGSAIAIKDFEFSPDPLEAKAGATITVKNDDSTAHTLTADDKSFDTGELDGGASGKLTLADEAGTVAYHCEIHDFMKGSIKVTA